MTDPAPNQKKPDACAFVIFGVTGDLTHRLVIPALYNLAATNLLPDNFCVVGVARSAMSNDDLRDSLMKGLRQFATRKVDDEIAKRLLSCVTCLVADPEATRLVRPVPRATRKTRGRTQDSGNRLFYLAVPAQRVCADQPRTWPRRHAQGE